MRFPRPRSLNGLILVGFGLVAVPLMVAVLWALYNLDRLATQSEQLVFSGVAAAENNRLLVEQAASLERVARQFIILRTPDSLQLLQQDQGRIEDRLEQMRELTEKANAALLLDGIAAAANDIVVALSDPELSVGGAQVAIATIAPLRAQVSQLTQKLRAHVDSELRKLQESTRDAQKVSAWQVAALIPGTIILVLFFTLLFLLLLSPHRRSTGERGSPRDPRVLVRARSPSVTPAARYGHLPTARLSRSY